MRRRKRMLEDLDQDIRDHIEMETRDNIERGMSPEEARYAALRKFGNVTRVKEETREVWSFVWLEQLLQDLRYGVRMLRKSPGFTAVAVLTLALGIGANTAIFSMVDWLILRPLPVAKAEQITSLALQEISGGYSNGFSYPDFEDIRDQSTAVFSQVAGVQPWEMDGLSTEGRDEPIWTSYVTGNFFETMGVKPALGSFILPMLGRSVNDEPVLVLGYSFWETHFSGDPNIIGKSVSINGHPVTIIGVAPKGFHGITPIMDTQGYLPLGMARVTSDLKSNFATDRKSAAVAIVARLRPGMKLREAQPALNVIARRLSAQYPATDKLAAIRVYPLGPIGPPSDPTAPNMIRLMGAFFMILAGLVLILACLNVANLLLARASARQREMAVRAAIGGGRSRLIRQLLTESLLLALLGCAGGIALGLVSSHWLSSINLKTVIPVTLDFQFDWRVFAYAFGAALLTGLLAGIVPALRATRVNLNSVLHESARTATAGHQRTRSALVVAQVGGSLMLLIVAGLFVRSLLNIKHSNLGFDPSRVLNFTIDPHGAGYDEAQARDFLHSLLHRVRALPGVETASFATTVPLGYYSFGMELKIEGYQPPPGHGAPSAGYNAVSPEYFGTMHIPIVRGRGILDSDGQTSARVAVINEAMAKRYWHGENPIGRRFIKIDDPKHPVEIVGVAGNSRTRNISSPFGPYMYVPFAQHYETPVTLQLRTSLPPGTMGHEVVSVIHSLAPAMPVFDIQTMTEALDTLNGLMLFQFGAALAASLGILGFLLALVGVYGVVSYAANQRTHEIGIRMALGAQPGDVRKFILKQGLYVVAAGLGLGLLLSLAASRIVGNFLVGVRGTDPLTYAIVAALLTTVALAACYIPARRAMRVDPMVALRHE